MLQKLNNHTVQGDGFRVLVPDIHKVIYSEDHRTAQVEIEGGMSAGTVDWLVYSETLIGWTFQGNILPMLEVDKESESLSLLEMPHRFA